MKKTYVKPMMESEEFVANEYVAACWTLDCQNVNCGLYKKVYGSDDAYSVGTMVSYETIDNLEPCTNKISKETITIDNWREFFELIGEAIDTNMTWGEFWGVVLFGKEVEVNTPFHPIEVTKGHPNHPNASV